MGEVTLDSDTHERLGLVAAAWGMEEGDAVAELLRRLSSGNVTKRKPSTNGSLVPIYFDYRGEHVEAEFDRRNHSVAITSGTLKGQEFPKPSPAAKAVVESVAEDVNPHRNGWQCWIVTSTGEPVESLRARSR